MQGLKSIVAAAAIVVGITSVAMPAAAQTFYTINGQPTPYNVAQYMVANGFPPGDYWLDAQGYWGVVGQSEPLGNIHAGTYSAPYGSGEQGSNGWSYYNNLSGMSVGGDSNGCYYVGDWSNC